MNKLFDPGLQPERTGLAWQRTCLSFLVGSLIAMKVLPPIYGPWAVLPGLAGALEAGFFLLMTRRRYVRVSLQLTAGRDDGSVTIADGRLIGLLTLTTFLAGVVTLAFTLAFHTR
jgi:hypothetical protein